MTTWNTTKAEAYQDGTPQCAGCYMPAAEAHHWLVRCDNRKGKGFKKLVDKPINQCHVCKDCHDNGWVDSYEFREVYMRQLIEDGKAEEIHDFLVDLGKAGKLVTEQMVLFSRIRKEVEG